MKKNLLYKCVFLFMMFSCFMGSLQAQKRADIANYPRLKHSLGMGAGFTTGYGLSYRYTPSEWGFQVNFAPYKVKNFEQYSFGVSFLYELVRLKSTSLYLYEGNHFLYKKEQDVVINYSPIYVPIMGTVEQSFWNNGIGFGVSALASENVSFDIMAGYALYNNLSEIKPTIEGAFYFKF